MTTAPPCPAAADPYRPRFHFTAPRHWINDPNGVCHHGGRYHLFYQYNPHAARWGDIHWGHASSADLVRWRDEPVALAPSPGHDQGGCFSGCIAVVDGLPTAYYTGDSSAGQVQCVATSPDLAHWTKQPQRTIAERPPGVSPGEFRDPYVFRDAGHWYMVVGAALPHERGACLLYRSADGVDWHYRHPLFVATDPAQGSVWECPNFLQIGDRWLLTVSQWPNLGALWFVGRFDDERFVAETSGVHDVDGSAFAHLAMRAPDGRVLQWAWINEQRDQDEIDADGWAGAITVPRELSIDGRGRLNLRPAAEVALLRGEPLPLGPAAPGPGTRLRLSGRCLDIEARFALHDRRKVGLTLFESPDRRESTRIVYWPEARRLMIERARSSINQKTRRQDLYAVLDLDPGEPLRLRVLVDHGVIAVHANDRVNLTTRVYPALQSSTGVTAFSEGSADVELQAWPMGSALEGRGA